VRSFFSLSCAKDPPIEQVLTQKEPAATQMALLPAVADRFSEITSCNEIPYGTSFVNIRFRLDNGEVSSPMCFSEAQLQELLLSNEVPDSQVNIYLKHLFYEDKAATPELAYLVGAAIANAYPLPPTFLPNCYSINVIATSDYPGDTYSNGGCPPGFIDQYTVRQAKSGGGQCILEAGFSGIRLRHKYTGQIVTIAFAALDDLTDPLIASGLSPEQAFDVSQNIMQGKYSIRQVWNLFQFRITPNLNFVQNLPEEELSDWKLLHIGIGIFAADGSVLSFYFAIGDVPLQCNSLILPVYDVIPFFK
jgi:hypothetical protein